MKYSNIYKMPSLWSMLAFTMSSHLCKTLEVCKMLYTLLSQKQLAYCDSLGKLLCLGNKTIGPLLWSPHYCQQEGVHRSYHLCTFPYSLVHIAPFFHLKFHGMLLQALPCSSLLSSYSSGKTPAMVKCDSAYFTHAPVQLNVPEEKHTISQIDITIIRCLVYLWHYHTILINFLSSFTCLVFCLGDDALNTFSLITILADIFTFYFTEKIEGIINEHYKFLPPLTLEELLVFLSKISFSTSALIASALTYIPPVTLSLLTSFLSSLFLCFLPISLQRICHFFHFKNDSTFLQYAPYLHSKTLQKTYLCQKVSLSYSISVCFPLSYSLLNQLQLGFPPSFHWNYYTSDLHLVAKSSSQLSVFTLVDHSAAFGS